MQLCEYQSKNDKCVFLRLHAHTCVCACMREGVAVSALHFGTLQKHPNPEKQKHNAGTVNSQRPIEVWHTVGRNSTPYFTLPQVQVCEVLTLHPGQAGSKGATPSPPPQAGLFWCYYENSTCSLWLWHCFQHSRLLWCASSGNACGEEMTEDLDGELAGGRDGRTGADLKEMWR